MPYATSGIVPQHVHSLHHPSPHSQALPRTFSAALPTGPTGTRYGAAAITISGLDHTAYLLAQHLTCCLNMQGGRMTSGGSSGVFEGRAF